MNHLIRFATVESWEPDGKQSAGRIHKEVKRGVGSPIALMGDTLLVRLKHKNRSIHAVKVRRVHKARRICPAGSEDKTVPNPQSTLPTEKQTARRFALSATQCLLLTDHFTQPQRRFLKARLTLRRIVRPPHVNSGVGRVIQDLERHKGR